MNGLVIDAEGGGRNPGTRLVMWSQKHGGDADNQLFYEDQMSGTIKSKASNLCLESRGIFLLIYSFKWFATTNIVTSAFNQGLRTNFLNIAVLTFRVLAQLQMGYILMTCH